MNDIVLNAQIKDSGKSAAKAAKNASKVKSSFNSAGTAADKLNTKSKAIGGNVGAASGAASKLKGFLSSAVTVGAALAAVTKVAAAKIEAYQRGLKNVLDTAAASAALKAGEESGLMPAGVTRDVGAVYRELWGKGIPVEKTMLMQAAQGIGSPAAQADVDVRELLKGIVAMWLENNMKGDLKRVARSVGSALLSGEGTGLARYGRGISPVQYEGLSTTEKIAAISRDLVKSFQEVGTLDIFANRPTTTQQLLLSELAKRTTFAEAEEAEAEAQAMQQIMYNRYVATLKERHGIDARSFWAAMGDNAITSYFAAQTMNPEAWFSKFVGRAAGFYPGDETISFLEGKLSRKPRVDVGINRTRELDRGE